MADFEVNERLEKLIKDVLKTSPVEFSKAYNDTKAVKTYHVLNQRNGLSMKMLDEIVKAYPNINRNWLLTGAGKPLLHKTTNTHTTEEKNRLLSIIEKQQETINNQQQTIAELVKKAHCNVAARKGMDVASAIAV